MSNVQVVVNPLLPFQVTGGILLAALILVLINKGMNIHRANDGWRSWFGAVMFIIGFMMATVMVLATPMGFSPGILDQ